MQRADEQRQQARVRGDALRSADRLAGRQVQRPRARRRPRRRSATTTPAADVPGRVADVRAGCARRPRSGRGPLPFASASSRPNMRPVSLEEPRRSLRAAPSACSVRFARSIALISCLLCSARRSCARRSRTCQSGGTKSVVFGASMTARPSISLPGRSSLHLDRSARPCQRPCWKTGRLPFDADLRRLLAFERRDLLIVGFTVLDLARPRPLRRSGTSGTAACPPACTSS